MNISLEFYKTFYYVAKNGSISRAANELFISQPAVSKTIKVLEEQLGTSLLIRKQDGVVLTQAGEIFYRKIKDAMDLMWSAENDLETFISQDSGTISIGASKTIIHEYLLPYLTSFHKLHPNIHFQIYTNSKEELIKKAKMGIIDLLFMNCPSDLPSDFHIIKVMNLHDVLVANQDFIKYKNKKLSIQDLEQMPLLLLNKGTVLRSNFDDFCTKYKLNIHPMMELDSNALIKDFTQEGFGVSLLTKEHIKKELDEGKLFLLDLDIPLTQRYLGVIYLKNREKELTKQFLKFIHLS